MNAKKRLQTIFGKIQSMLRKIQKSMYCGTDNGIIQRRSVCSKNFIYGT